MSTDKEIAIEELWRGAQDYAEARVNAELPGLARLEQTEMLCVEFLFPNVSKRDSALLTKLRLARLGATLCFNAPRENIENQEEVEFEKAASTAEFGFMEAKAHVLGSGLMDKLSAIQTAILYREFLQIRFIEVLE